MPLVIGTNIGTTVTIIIGAIGGQQVKRRVALSHLLFNLITGVVALVLLPVFTWLILDVFNYAGNNVSGIALFHTMFNLMGILLFLPFIGWLARWLIKIFPDRKPDLTIYIDQVNPEVGEAAIEAIRKEIIHITKEVLRFNLHLLRVDQGLILPVQNNGQKEHHISPITFESINLLQAEVFTFAAHVQSFEIGEDDADKLQRYLHSARTAVHAAKSLVDVKGEIEDFENSDNPFLNEQYARFRKRMTGTYLKLATHYENEQEYIPAPLTEIVEEVNREDRLFIKETTEAINHHVIRDMEVSASLVVNRAYVHSCRELIQALQGLQEPEK